MIELTVMANLFALFLGFNIAYFNVWYITPVVGLFAIITLFALILDADWLLYYLQYRREKRREEKYKQYK